MLNPRQNGRRGEDVLSFRNGGRTLWPARLMSMLLGSAAAVWSSQAQAQDATWLAAPASNELTAGANWSTGSVPTGTAYFGPSGQTSLVLPVGGGLLTLGSITLNANAANYTITTHDIVYLSGAGLVVNGGSLTLEARHIVNFEGNASAGSATINNYATYEGLHFWNNSSAGSSTITTFANAITTFHDNTTLGNATLITDGYLNFWDAPDGGTSRQIIHASGVLDFSVMTTNSITFGSIEGAGAMYLADVNLTVGSNNLSTTFSGGIWGNAVGLTKIGTGTLTLTGSSYGYSGNTTVNGGTLLVDGTLTNTAGIFVNSSGTLGGSGTVSQVTINNGGTLAPGDATTTLNVSGRATFNAQSAYAVSVSPSSATKAALTGTASLTGGTVTATFLPGSYQPSHFTILTSSGLGGTTFAGLTVVNKPSTLQVALRYTATDVILDITGQSAPQNPSMATNTLNVNQRNVANALNTYSSGGGALPPGFVTLFGMSGSGLGGALDQVSGQGNAGATQTAFNASSQFIDAMMGAAGGADGAGGAPDAGRGGQAYAAERPTDRSLADAYAAVSPHDVRSTFDGRWSTWISGYGGSSTVAGDSNAGTQSTISRIYGSAAGADYRFINGTRLGFAMGGAGTSFATSGGLGGGQSDLLQVGVNARHDFGRAYIAGALVYGWQDMKTSRTLTVAGVDRLEANLHAQSFAGRLEAGYRFVWSWIGVAPYASLQSTTFHLPGYSEYAALGSNQFAQTLAAQTATDLRTELGLRLDRSFLLSNAALTLRGRAAWAHDDNTSRVISASFQSLPSTSFTIDGARPAADAALVGFGADMRWAGHWSLGASYEGEFSRTTISHAGKGSLRFAW